ncbi:cytochrome P450 [Ephemerocybe angulata]|uniref:Cytochrome P450 n=1 Tax=Ephemerocybe angulata TaxID=980116 RepID=A0A8H6MAW5_9AGAR|nr:cytochrome P450 [Tulosesus angulatus]
MLAPDSLLKLVPSVLVAFIGWNLVRRFVFPSPLDKLPGPPLSSFIAGHLPQMFSPDGWGFHRSLVEKYGRVVRLYGFLRARILYVSDPKALHHIFIKDQHIFEESNAILGSNNAIFGEGLLATLGETHKKQRRMLNPVFSIKQMRTMIPKFFAVTYDLRDVLLRKTVDGPQQVDMLTWTTRTALEIVAQAVLGQSFDPVSETHEEHPYISAMKLLGPTGRQLLMFRQFVLANVYKYNIGTPRIQRFLLGLVPSKALQRMRGLVDVMYETSLSIFEAKKKALAESGDVCGGQDDFLSVLMRENAKASEEDKLPDHQVVAQISTIMFAAMDTTSSALSRILHLLAEHPEVQDRLHAEIRGNVKRSGGEPDYDQLSALPYLDAVIRETLRVHPPIASLPRETRKDALLPFSEPVKATDGQYISEVLVPKSTLVVVSIKAINTDPGMWGADAHEWKPERWLAPIPEAVVEARVPGVYSHLMTFIGGGRACIGFKFSEMEMKVILYVIIDLFRFSLPNSKEPIFWNMIGISTPFVNKDELRPALPLVVSRADM